MSPLEISAYIARVKENMEEEAKLLERMREARRLEIKRREEQRNENLNDYWQQSSNHDLEQQQLDGPEPVVI